MKEKRKPHLIIILFQCMYHTRIYASTPFKCISSQFSFNNHTIDRSILSKNLHPVTLRRNPTKISFSKYVTVGCLRGREW